MRHDDDTIIGTLYLRRAFDLRFRQQTLITAATEQQHHLWAWFALEVASAGVFVYACIPLIFSTSIADSAPRKPARNERAWPRWLLSIYLGLNPGHLYGILPHGEVLAESLVLHLHQESIIVTVLQMLLFSALCFSSSCH